MPVYRTIISVTGRTKRRPEHETTLPDDRSCNASWDLVDRVLEDDFRWGSLYDEELPEAMRSMTADGRREYVDTKRSERETIQQEIQRLSEERETFIKIAMAEAGGTGLGDAMREAIRDQAMAKGFKCDGC